tara:strand:+ start:338 stop:490 length:153 start_codon:yes stop_codon:yes gene_type:complete
LNCLKCDEKLIWQSDDGYEDHDINGEGIVSNFSCNNCNSFVMVYTPEGEE